ncbi:MAG: hypothetical protein L0H94_05230 [Nitrospira sp.]|nr:hypothetical protein [Nitrospira sp.]
MINTGGADREREKPLIRLARHGEPVTAALLFPASPRPQNTEVGGFLSSREDRRQRKIWRREDRSNDKQIGKLLTQLGNRRGQP